MNSILLTEIKFDTKEYWYALRMREIELRLPIGMRYSTQDIEKEATERIFVAIAQNKIISTAQYIIAENRAKMRQVATKKLFQGQGIGRDLYHLSEKILAENKINEIYCHARLSAKDFYTKLGFEIYSEEFIEVGIPHVKMRKRINK